MERGIKLRIKINNSYESEPSSGSGSSLSGHIEGQVSDEENINLPYILKPRSCNIVHSENNTNDSKNSIPHSRMSSLSNATPINSDGQESPFCGFGDSPYGNVNKRLYGSQYDKLKLPEPQKQETKRVSPGKLVFPKFYDTIVDENSCNAVYLQLSHKTAKDIPVAQFSSNDEVYNLNTTSMANNVDLSFNGIIKSLTKQNVTINNELPTTSGNCPLATLQASLSTAMESTINTSQLTESFILRKYNNEKSPDIFADSDDDDNGNEDANGIDRIAEEPEETGRKTMQTTNSTLTAEKEQMVTLQNTANGSNFEVDEKTLDCSATQSTGDKINLHLSDNFRKERELLRRIRRSLGGIRPPPSVTIPQLDIVSTVVNLKSDILNFLKTDKHQNETLPSNSNNKVKNRTTTSLFKPSHTLGEVQAMCWPEVLGARQHGISYNLSQASECNEYLSLSVIERFIGAETASSYIKSPSSAKKRSSRLKLLTQSPGNRLSHLAKRRAIFSSANLATNSLKLNNSFGPQIVIDKKKVINKRKATPKRKTPTSKKKNRKTPTSSARKRLYRCDLIKPGPSRETSKRALFQSPAKTLTRPQTQPPPKPLFKPEIANRVEKSKRALFSPDNEASSTNDNNCFVPSTSSSTQLDTLLKRKRNTADDEDMAEFARQSSKLFRSDTSNLTPRALKIKSQSFCIGAGSSKTLSTCASAAAGVSSGAPISSCLALSSSQILGGSNSSLLSGNKLQRAHSDIAATQQNLTENQRKKLLWAVSQALQERKITVKHENFRHYASVLVRAVKRIFQEFYQKNVTSNSETMLRLAKRYVHNVMSGKNADEIYCQAKTHINDFKRQSSTRLSGYIAPEQYEQLKLSQQSMLSQSSQSLSQQMQRNKYGSVQNIFVSENSIDSCALSQFASQSSQTFNVLDHLTQDAFPSITQNSNSSSKSIGKQLPIQSNAGLQNSSSKNNLNGLALRENVDCELRRSAQKNFTGKDQRNVSPYNGSLVTGSGRKVQSQLIGEACGSGAKAKRQISFDS